MPREKGYIFFHLQPNSPCPAVIQGISRKDVVSCLNLQWKIRQLAWPGCAKSWTQGGGGGEEHRMRARTSVNDVQEWGIKLWLPKCVRHLYKQESRGSVNKSTW